MSRSNKKKLYHILNCQGTITLESLDCQILVLYHILNCQGTITGIAKTIFSLKLYHILNCQGTITVRSSFLISPYYIIF